MEKRIDILILGIFCAVLVAGMVLGAPVPALLAVGFLLFFGRGLTKGIPAKTLFRAAGKGMWKARSVLLTLALIGCLTALWRGSGTIAYLITVLSPVLQPGMLPLAAFFLCGLTSVLMGTSFGTAATAGVISVSVAQACGGNVALVGGAALAGCYVGDRCSPISTAALLCAELSGTRLSENLTTLFRDSLLPLAACIAAYAALGALGAPADPADGAASALLPPYGDYFTLNALALLPAASVVGLALFRVDVKLNVLVSCGVAFLLCVAQQNAAPLEALRWMAAGFDGAANLPGITGGGLVSMLNPVAIIAVASTFSGLFQETRMLEGVDGGIDAMDRRLGSRLTAVLVSLALAAVSLNQTLTIMMTHQLMGKRFVPGKDTMLMLEDTALMTATLVPWCIAVAVPLATMDLGLSSIPAAIYLWLVPLWYCLRPRRSAEGTSR